MLEHSRPTLNSINKPCAMRLTTDICDLFSSFYYATQIHSIESRKRGDHRDPDEPADDALVESQHDNVDCVAQVNEPHANNIVIFNTIH